MADKKKIAQTEIDDTEKFVLRQVRQGQTMLCFESETKKLEVCGGKTRSESGKNRWVDQAKADNEFTKHTLRFVLDFDGVTVAELVRQHASVTSFVKMFQNNVTKYWDEDFIVTTCTKSRNEPYVVSIRDLLDGRKAKRTEGEKVMAMAVKALQAGKLSDNEKAELAKLLGL